MSPEQILARLEALRVPRQAIADAIGLTRPQASKMFARTGTPRGMKASEVAKLLDLIAKWEGVRRAERDEVPLAPEGESQGYLPVEVLPTFAGMGGGGTGDGDVEHALVPRALIENVLRGRAGDFVLINVRGDSMEPKFHQDDQILVDRRDVAPTQPGPFALWDGDGYVVKNVERAPGGKLRIFSTNPEYGSHEYDPDEIRILGRPVWFGRRL